jgi:hypothetical protein
MRSAAITEPRAEACGLAPCVGVKKSARCIPEPRQGRHVSSLGRKPWVTDPDQIEGSEKSRSL